MKNSHNSDCLFSFLYLCLSKNKLLEKELYKLITDAKQLAIVIHVNPDGDAMGSALAMLEFVGSCGIKSQVFSPTKITTTLDWMPYRDKVAVFDSDNQEQLQFLTDVDTVLFVDHSVEKQSGGIYEYLSLSEKKSAFIDHHPYPSLLADIGYSQVNSAAACCVVYELLKSWEVPMTKSMATCLFTGICTDTGNFKYGNNLEQAFRIASELMQLGIDRQKIIDALFYSEREDSLRLLGYVLSEKMHLVSKEVAYISLSAQELKDNNEQQGDTDNIVNYPLAIKTVEVSAIFIEREDCIKISFRSKGQRDVSELARKYFNGGGHRNASGGRFYGNMNDAINEYIKRTK